MHPVPGNFGLSQKKPMWTLFSVWAPCVWRATKEAQN